MAGNEIAFFVITWGCFPHRGRLSAGMAWACSLKLMPLRLLEAEKPRLLISHFYTAEWLFWTGKRKSMQLFSGRARAARLLGEKLVTQDPTDAKYERRGGLSRAPGKRAANRALPNDWLINTLAEKHLLFPQESASRFKQPVCVNPNLSWRTNIPLS